MSQNKPIGVFDSGIGGLTVLKALQSHFPYESFIYIGDTARLPYGTKSPETVARYAANLTKEILHHDVQAIIVACNTASTHGLTTVKALAKDIPVIGMIDPAAETAVSVSRTGHIGVIATSGTIKSEAYKNALIKQNPDCKISSVACQILVALAEEGWANTDIAKSTLHTYLDPIFKQKNSPDTLILGCTHFPLFAPLIEEMLGMGVTLINSGEAASHHLAKLIKKNPSEEISPKIKFFVTDDPQRFAENAAKFYNDQITPEDVMLIDIQS